MAVPVLTALTALAAFELRALVPAHPGGLARRRALPGGLVLRGGRLQGATAGAVRARLRTDPARVAAFAAATRPADGGARARRPAVAWRCSASPRWPGPPAVLAWLARPRAGARRARVGLRSWHSRRAVVVATALAAVAVAVALAVSASAFFDAGPGRHLTTKAPGGNFFGQLSPLEALGVWRQADFRIAPSTRSSSPACCSPARWSRFGSGVVLAAARLGAAGGRPRRGHRLRRRCARSRRPTSTARRSRRRAAADARRVEGARDGGIRARAGARRWVPALAAALLGLYLIVGGASSALALRGARVRPSDRGQRPGRLPARGRRPADALPRSRQLRPWELRGARLRGFQSYDTPLALGRPRAAVQGQATRTSRRRRGLRRPGLPRLLPLSDHVAHRVRLRRCPTTSGRLRARAGTCSGSGSAARCRAADLAEGEAPGKVLDCRTTTGRRLAESGGSPTCDRSRWSPGRAWRTATGPAPRSGLAWEALNGESRTQVLRLPAGRGTSRCAGSATSR